MLKDVILAYLLTDVWPVGYKATSINAKFTIKDKEKPSEKIIKCKYFCMGSIWTPGDQYCLLLQFASKHKSHNNFFVALS